MEHSNNARTRRASSIAMRIGAALFAAAVIGVQADGALASETVASPRWAGANDDRAETTQGQPVEIDVLANDDFTLADGEGIRQRFESHPTLGVGTWSVTADQRLRFVPDPDFVGVAEGGYSTTGSSRGATANVSVAVRPDGAAPTDVITTEQGHPVTRDVDGFYSRGYLIDFGQDGDGWPVDRTEWTVPGTGTWTLGNDDGPWRLTFTPDPGFVGVADAHYWMDASFTAGLTASVRSLRVEVVPSPTGGL